MLVTCHHRDQNPYHKQFKGGKIYLSSHFRGLNPLRLGPILLIEHGIGNVWLIFNYWETGNRERGEIQEGAQAPCSLQGHVHSVNFCQLSLNSYPSPHDNIILFMNTLRAWWIHPWYQNLHGPLVSGNSSQTYPGVDFTDLLFTAQSGLAITVGIEH